MADPRVIVTVKDQTQGIGGTSDLYGACVGPSSRGPTDITLVDSTKQFIELYGKPSNTDTNDANFHYTCMMFLESAPMYILRAVNTALYGGVHIVKSGAVGASAAIAAGTATPDTYSFGADDTFALFGQNPGAWNNNLRVSVGIEASSVFTITVEETTDGGVTYTTVETWEVSKTQGKKNGFGENIYIETRINDNSTYIYAVDNTAVTDGPKLTADLSLATGANGSAVTATQIILGWQEMQASDKQLDILLAAGWGGLGGSPSDTSVPDAITDCAEEKGGFAILDGPDSTTASTVVSTVGGWSQTNPRYSSAYAPYMKFVDTANNKNAFAPPSGFVGEAFATTYAGGKRWDVPAGLSRGVLGKATGARTVWSKTERDTLTAGKVNPIKFVQGVGYVIGGDWTLNATETVLQSVGGQQNLTEIVTDVKEFLESFIFENNTAATRQRVTSRLDEYFLQRQNEGGIDDSGGDGWGVTCNETNNTSLIRSQHKLVVDIYLRLPRSIRYIYLNITLVDGDITVSEPTS